MVQLFTDADGPRLYETRTSGTQSFKVPSTTEILKVVSRGYLDAWRHRVGHKEANRLVGNATQIGTRVHAALSDVVQGKRIVVADDIRPMIEAAEKFLALHVDEVLAAEWSLASARQGFGGTLDLYCRLLDGSHAVVDWKTSRQLTRTVGHQLAAYALLIKEQGKPVNRRIGVRLKKENGKLGDFHARAYEDHKGDVRVIRACCELWWAANAQKKDALVQWSPGELAGEDVA